MSENKMPERILAKYSDNPYWGRFCSCEHYEAACDFIDEFMDGKSTTEYLRADLVLRWISVQERLPEDDRDILMVRIISGKQTYCIGHYDHSSRCFMFRGYTVNVTHWQALPTYPQEG